MLTTWWWVLPGIPGTLGCPAQSPDNSIPPMYLCRTVSSLIVSLYKRKRLPEDVVPKREGELDTNTGWTALDMSNIVLHLLVQEKREYYDLEMLWTVGPDFDDNTRNLMASEESKIDTLEDLMAATDVDMEELFGRKDQV